MKTALNERLIVALDVGSQPEALKIVSILNGVVNFFKIGLELFIAAGPSFVREIKEKGCKVFLDLKLHDIPNTVARSVESAGHLGVDFLTIHAVGGKKMIETARQETDKLTANGIPLKLLGVTLLTSLSETELKNELGVSRSLDMQVEELAQMATKSGCHGVVASPLEAKRLRLKLGSSPTIVTPGIRFATSKTITAATNIHDDQIRTATPKEAIMAGADYLVVGRPIISAPDTKEAAIAIIEDMKNACKELEHAAT